MAQPIITPPNTTILQGALAISDQDTHYESSWNARTGGQTKIISKGSKEKILGTIKEAKNFGWEYSLIVGHVWQSEVIVPWDWLVDGDEPPPGFVWENGFTPYEVDLFEVQRPLISVLTTATKDKIELALKNTSKRTDVTDSNNFSAITEANIVFNLKRSGVQTRQDFLPTIKRTFMVGNSFDITGLVFPQFDNKVFTKAELLQTYDRPSVFIQAMPISVKNLMPNTLPVADSKGVIRPVTAYSVDKSAIVTFTGWRQYPVESSPASLTKTTYVQQWILNSWSCGSFGLYEAKNGAPGPTKQTIDQILFASIPLEP